MSRRVQSLLRHGTTSRRVLCCLSVSVGTTVLSAVILVALVVGAGVPAGTANVIAVCCGILPSYLANRRWTWGRSGKGSVAREVVPFWALSIAGLVVSTMTVAAAGALTADWSPALRSLVLPVVQAGTFALLWVVQFVVLDRVIFRPTSDSPFPTSPDRDAACSEHELAA